MKVNITKKEITIKFTYPEFSILLNILYDWLGIDGLDESICWNKEKKLISKISKIKIF